MALIPAGGYNPDRYVNRPENSFSSADIFRFVANNITKEERFHVMYFFCVIIPATGFIVDIIELLTLMFPPSRWILKVFKIMRLISGLWERIFPYETSLLMLFLPSEVRKEANGLLAVLDKEYYLTEE